MRFALYVLLISCVTFALYAWDKAQAKRKGWRVPESTLLLFGLLGGTFGALLGQRLLRHKTYKRSFRRQFWGVTLFQIGILVLWGQPDLLLS